MDEPRCRSETNSSFASSPGEESGNRHYDWLFRKNLPANAIIKAGRECFDLAFKSGEGLGGQTRLNPAIQDTLVRPAKRRTKAFLS